MDTRKLLKAVAILAIVGGSTFSIAADTRQMPMQGMMGQQPGMMGMMGQSGMMGCPMMLGGMGGGMMGSRGLPSLPPGNEKLQLQMQAEIMQKVGEIMAKYAAQVQSR